MLTPHHPAPARGALRPIVTKRGAGCDGCGSTQTMRGARVRRNRVVLVPRRWDQARGLFSCATVANKPDTGESTPSNHCAGKAGMFRRTCIHSCAFCAFCRAHEAAGATVHPAFPAPSLFPRDDDQASLGQILPRERWRLSPSTVMPREGGIQYSRGVSVEHNRLWNTGSPDPVSAKASTGPAVSGAPKPWRRRKSGDDSELAV